MTMGEKILRMRKARCWSQEELVEHVGVSRQAVSRWESDSAKPDADKIIALSDIFGVSADYLLREQYSGGGMVELESQRKETTALGDALRALTLKQWIGSILLLIGCVTMLILKILSGVYPCSWNDTSGLFAIFADLWSGISLVARSDGCRCWRLDCVPVPHY